jgi:hypothetical protein
MIRLHDLTDEFAGPASASPSLLPALKRVLDRCHAGVVAGREAQAARLVRRHLAPYDDADLTRLGWTAEQIKSMRTPA